MYTPLNCRGEGHKQGRTGCGDAYLLELWVGRQRLQKRRLPMFNVTRGPVKGSETFASCRGKAGWRSPIETDSSSRPGEDGQFTAESVGVITETTSM